MDFSESTKIVYGRIQQVEPELASKIVGYLLLQDNGDREMIRLAFSPDNVIHSITNRVKRELGLVSPKQSSFPQNAPATAFPLQLTSSYWNSQFTPQDQDVEFLNPSYVDLVPQDYHRLHNQMQPLCLDEHVEFPSGNRNHSRLPVPGIGLSEMPSKVCHYFSKGFCKHGSSCRYLHGNPNEGFNEDQLFSPRSVENLELELTELLRSRNGVPVSIALLPMLYYEKYGRTLQAEGYLTESQRHGKAGYSLTRLLARMRTSIRLIERAHGQHSVILSEDLPKYLEHANEQNERGGVPIGARQIYLTFPAESIFTEQDVSNYFNNGYGPVQDVRIPCQQKRMFGFVTFIYPETVRKVLAKGNPHFICGARVLVKPYREKSRLTERKNAERKHLTHFSLQFIDGDFNVQPNSVSRTFNDIRLVRKHLVEEHELDLELERTRLSEFQLAHKPVTSGHGIGHSTAGLKLNEVYVEQTEFSAPERFNFVFDILKDGSTSEERASNQGLDLPDSPFANSIANSISTVT